MLFIIITGLVLCNALPSLNRYTPVNGYTRVSSIVLLFCAILTYNTLNIESFYSGITIYGGLFHINNITQFIDIFLFLIASIILVIWPLIRLEVSYTTNYSLIILFSLLGSSLLVASYDLISIFLSLELQSLAVYVLATLDRNSLLSTGAGLKYFLLGALSSCFILLGIALIYSFTGLTNIDSIYMLIQGSYITSVLHGFYLGLSLIFVGFLFKIAAAPLHNWAPDVYDDTPTFVTTWLTIMPKISILFLLLELYTGFNISSNNLELLKKLLDFTLFENLYYINSIISNLFIISSLLSLLIGSIVGLVQINIKRLLAFSTISHVGFIILALSLNTQLSINSFIFYIIQYTITNLNIFLIIIAFTYITNIKTHLYYFYQKIAVISDIKQISELKNQLFFNPLIAICLCICIFSMAGIPPLIGFFGKLSVLHSTVESGYYFISLVIVIVSVISASYYLKIIRVLSDEDQNNEKFYSKNSRINIDIVDNEGKSIKNFDPKKLNLILKKFKWGLLSPLHSFAISAITLKILVFIIKPAILLNSTSLLSLSIYKC